MENKSAGGEENVMEMQSDADDSAIGCAPADEVASAVTAVSDEIGDILKDELGDAEQADRIELELADLSAELGILAGLADGEAQPGFPSLFEMAVSTWKSRIFHQAKWLTEKITPVFSAIWRFFVLNFSLHRHL